MDLQLIGKENLPNVYIDTIRVNSDDLFKTISVTISLFDHIHDLGRSWYRDDLDLKIKLCLVHRNSKISKLISGVDTLFLQDGLRQITILSKADFEFTSHSNTVDKFSTTIAFDKIPNEDAETTAVFCSCFIDNLGFENDLFNQYYGPLTGEKILTSGEIAMESGYFYNPLTNEEYGGPVHDHAGKFMVGSQHSSQAHDSLIYVKEPNYKISEVRTHDQRNETVQELEDMEMASPNPVPTKQLAVGITYE
jgi:hypothetical protein